jgi:hypothetical protein
MIVGGVGGDGVEGGEEARAEDESDAMAGGGVGKRDGVEGVDNAHADVEAEGINGQEGRSEEIGLYFGGVVKGDGVEGGAGVEGVINAPAGAKTQMPWRL